MGISSDESRRMRQSKYYWIEHWYPLIFGLDRPYRRYDCYVWLRSNGHPDPPRSACLGCPYRTTEEWRVIKENKKYFDDVVEFDKKVRNKGGKKGELFVHQSCKPISEVDFRSDEEKGQLNWINECEGMCGV